MRIDRGENLQQWRLNKESKCWYFSLHVHCNYSIHTEEKKQCNVIVAVWKWEDDDISSDVVNGIKMRRNHSIEIDLKLMYLKLWSHFETVKQNICFPTAARYWLHLFSFLSTSCFPFLFAMISQINLWPVVTKSFIVNFVFVCCASSKCS